MHNSLDDLEPYRYNESDDDLALWGRNFTSRMGDGEGDHEEAYLDTLKLIFELRQGGSLIEIGAGFGRIVSLALPTMGTIVGLEPDFDRFRYCHDTYDDPPACRILQRMSHEFIRENPGAVFDVVVVSMVLQHLATDVCEALLADAHRLAGPGGVVVVATTHGPESDRRFTTSGAQAGDPPLSREEFDAYAKAVSRQDRGIPVRRFTRKELLDLVSERFDILHWEQFSYIRPERLEFFAERLGVTAAELAGHGDSQFLVMRRKRPDAPSRPADEVRPAEADVASAPAPAASDHAVPDAAAEPEPEIEAVPDLPRVGYVDKGTQLLLGMKYRELARAGELPHFHDVEFSNYSQTGEDGILNLVFALVGTTNRTLVEMCAGIGSESNSANLLVNHGWNGALFDGDPANIAKARGFFRYHPKTWYRPPRIVQAWITAENVNDLIRQAGISGEIDFFSLDMDGMDYWVWKALSVISPRVVMLEIHAPWLCDAAVTIPYRPDFTMEWVTLPDGNVIQYAGASLPAFMKLAAEKGYRLVGGNRLGFNVVFVRNDVGVDLLPEVDPRGIFLDPVMNEAYRLIRPGVEGLEWEEV